MRYEDILRRKNGILAWTLLICILLRSFVNAYFTGFAKVVPMMLAGLGLTALLLLLSRKLKPVVMMYLMVALMTGISIMLMNAFPCATNYLMFFLTIFFVVIYEDIRPIALQCALSAACMIYFYYRYTEKIGSTFTPDCMAMCVIYIVSGMLVYISLSRLTREQLENLRSASERSEQETEKANRLLQEITSSVDHLGQTSGRISDSVTVTNEISGQIGIATDDAAKRTAQEAADTERIRQQLKTGVDHVQAVSESSSELRRASTETRAHVKDGGDRVNELAESMETLDGRMQEAADSMAALSEQTKQIGEILKSLNGITSQTTLLSLNASIEAARAGEAGRGFAVVADEIRSLSDNSAAFSDQIREIIQEIAGQTKKVIDQMHDGLESVDTCVQKAEEVQGFFGTISSNTEEVLTEASGIDRSTTELYEMLQKTLSDVSDISGNIESTSAAMEEITTSISDLNGNISNVVDGYNSINSITNALIEAGKGKDA